MATERHRSDEHLAMTQALWPQLKARSLFPVGDGWTCDTYEVDGRWIVQFPRSEYAEQMLRKQSSALPALAYRLPYPIPEPISPRRDRPAAMLYRKIVGEPISDAPAGTWPEDLGKFLGALQSIGSDEIGMSHRPVSQLRADRERELQDMAERVLPLLSTGTAARFETAFAEHIGRDEFWEFQPVLVHADLGPAHILVDRTGRLAGVIDWEELAVGDPALDFAWLIHEMPEIGKRVVGAAGVEPDRGWDERARFLCAVMTFHEALHGLDTGQHLYVELGVRGIEKRAELLG